MIFAYIGKPGQGKTLYAAFLIDNLLKQGKTVYTNIHFNYTHERLFYFSDFSIIHFIHNGEFVLDEGQVYLNSREWASMPKETQILLQQHRHQGINIYAFTQSIKRMDTTFRELIHEFFEIRKVVVTGKAGGLLLLFELNAENVEKAEKLKKLPEFIWFSRKLLKNYNTHAWRTQDDEAIQIDLCPLCNERHHVTCRV